MKNFLPLGSVVMLKNGKKRLMICGRVQMRVSENTIFDYTGCLFPEGIVDPKEMYLFNNEDIETIYFLGLQDVEEFEFRDFMNKQLEKIEQQAKQ